MTIDLSSVTRANLLTSEFEKLKGLTLTDVQFHKNGMYEDNDVVIFYAGDDVFLLFHEQDCCENVTCEDIVGDLTDLVGVPILEARLECNESEDMDSVAHGNTCTWSFYKLSTIKGDVTLRWQGVSNGYYSETVDFFKLKR
jgi:hypothetical protein